MKFLLPLMLVMLPAVVGVAAADSAPEQQTDESQTSTVAPAVISQPESQAEPTSEPHVDSHPELDESDNEARRERFVLYIDALKYRTTTLDVESSRGGDRNETSISSSTTTATLRALDIAVGLQSYHDRLILGFGLSSNIIAAHDASSGGVIMAGYQLFDSLEVGGLLYIASRESETNASREDTVDDQLFINSEVSRTVNSAYAFGPWLKMYLGDYWAAQFVLYYSTSHTEQSADNNQQMEGEIENSRIIETAVERSYFALDLVFGPQLPITEHLTFVPQINVTWYLPRNYTRTTTMSANNSGRIVNEKELEFDEQTSFDYALILGGLRYEF